MTSPTVVSPPSGRQPPPAVRRRRRLDRRQITWALLFLSPAFIAIAAFRLAPALAAITSSFFSGPPGGVVEPTFAGFKNYVTLFENPAFVDTLWRTLLFSLIINPLQIFLALLVAVLFTRRIRLTGLWRTLVFVPATVPIVGSSIAWSVAMRPEGPLNAIIVALGGTPQPFLNSPDQALASIILLASWIGIGYWMIFLIDGIRAIPEELYEAARLDRAGPIRTFLQITIPLLKRPLLFVLVADTVSNFVLFAPIQILTGGGPESSTTLLMFDAYRTTYGYGNRNLGAAEVVVLMVIMLVIVIVQFRLLRETKEKLS